MGVAVDFAADEFFGTGQSQCGDLLAQFLAGLVGRLFDFGIGTGLHALRFGNGFVLGGVDDLQATGFGLGDDFIRFDTGFAKDFVDLLFGLGEILLAAVGGGETVGNLGLTLFDRGHDARPTEFHHDPSHREEREALDDER